MKHTGEIQSEAAAAKLCVCGFPENRYCYKNTCFCLICYVSAGLH